MTEGIRCTEPLPRRELVPWRRASAAPEPLPRRGLCSFRGLVPVGTGACTVPLLRWCAPVAGLFPAVHPFSCDAPLSAVRGLPDIIPVRPPVRPSCLTSCPALLPDLLSGPLLALLSGRRQPRAGAATGETYACNGIRRAERGAAPRQLFILVKHFRNRTAIPRASPMSNRFGRSSDWLLFRSLPGTRPVAEMFGMLRSFTAAGLSGNCTRFPFHPRLRKGASEPNLREQI